MNISATLKKFGLEKTFDYLYKEPEKNLRTLLRTERRQSIQEKRIFSFVSLLRTCKLISICDTRSFLAKNFEEKKENILLNLLFYIGKNNPTITIFWKFD